MFAKKRATPLSRKDPCRKERAMYKRSISNAELKKLRPWAHVKKDRKCFQPLFEGEPSSIIGRVRPFIPEAFQLAAMRKLEKRKATSVPGLTVNKANFAEQLKFAEDNLKEARGKVEKLQAGPEKDMMMDTLEDMEEWMEK
jgi:hypothetical protein